MACAPLLLAAPQAVAGPPEPDSCVVDEEEPTIVTCSGDLSGGVVIDASHGPYDKLILVDMEEEDAEDQPGWIAPTGAHGISIVNAADFTLENSEDDTFTILTTGDSEHGISVAAQDDATGVVTIDSHGSIETQGDDSAGIFIDGKRLVIDVRHQGDIKTLGSNANAIYVSSNLEQLEDLELPEEPEPSEDPEPPEESEPSNELAVKVSHQGSIELNGDDGLTGIRVRVEGLGGASITQRGDILIESESSSQSNFGIHVEAGHDLAEQSGDIDIHFNGDFIASNGAGAQAIHAVVDYENSEETSASINLTHIGNIGIYANGSGAEDRAIYTQVNQGKATINYTGELRMAGEYGIEAHARGDGGSAHIILGRGSTSHDGERVSGAEVIADEYGIYFNTADNAANQLALYNEVVFSISGTEDDRSDIFGGEGNTTINNYGTFTSSGTINLSQGMGFLNNRAGARFYSGEAIILSNSDEFDEMVDVLVDEQGNMVRTQYDDEDVPSGLSLEERRINTFTNAGYFSPRGIVADSLEIEDDEDTEADESYSSEITAGLGTTQLTGNFVQTETGIFAINIDTENKDSDLLEVVRGSAYLGGIIRVESNGSDSEDDHRYVFLTVDEDEGGLIEGAFIVPYVSSYEVDYDVANEVALVFRGHRTLCDPAVSKNEKAVACQGVSALPNDQGIGGILHRLETAEQLQAAYSALSGDIHPSLLGVMMESSSLRSDAVLARLNAFTAPRSNRNRFALSHDANLYKDQLSQLNWWIKGQGGVINHDADSGIGTAALEHEASGLVIGADYSNEDFTIGAVFGMGKGTSEFDGRPSEGELDTSTMGVYGSSPLTLDQMHMHLHFGVFGNYYLIETKRTVMFQDFYERLAADYEASSLQAFAELTGEFDLNGSDTLIQPFFNLSHITLETDGYTETALGVGSSSAALRAEESSTSLLGSKLGVRASTNISSRSERSQIKIFGELGWRFNLGDLEPESRVSFAGGDSFSIAGSPLPENSLSAQVGISARLSRNLHVTAGYAGEFGEAYKAHNINAGLISFPKLT
ncbi:MAG: autotransporter outer membrane beta-barrel domain-containing protein, partial [Rhizobiaceae bacterium]|nr:autotransporter outer membrane beta-barrel domain-containing protein [Hyphomicrobiales bacterium]NRB32593.1 autotransporter outer membrane beta-barrel domain-containing protein [Rhizobiaceae bacterium]